MATSSSLSLFRYRFLAASSDHEQTASGRLGFAYAWVGHCGRFFDFQIVVDGLSWFASCSRATLIASAPYSFAQLCLHAVFAAPAVFFGPRGLRPSLDGMAFEALMALSFEGDPAAPTQELSPAAPTLQPPKAKWATPSAPAKWAAPRTPPKAPPKSPRMETAKTSAPMATDVDEGDNDVHDDKDGKSAGGKSRSRAHLPFRQLSGKSMKRGGALGARFRFFPKHSWPLCLEQTFRRLHSVI